MGCAVFQIHTDISTIGLAIFASHSTRSFHTNLSGFAQIAALSAMFGIRFDIGAHSATKCCICRTLARTRFTQLACGTGIGTFATVFWIDLGVHAISRTIGQRGLTRQRTLADRTDFAIFAFVPTSTTVIAIHLGVDTFVGTYRLARRTQKLAFASFTSFPGFAYIATGSAMFGSDVQIDTFPFAFMGTVGTVESAFAAFTNFSLTTGGSALSTVFAVKVQFNASVVADGFASFAL